MQPIHDTDVLVLLAVTTASKRRPGTLEELVVALAMIQDKFPAEAKLSDGFARLTSHGLVLAQGEGYTLSDAAQKIMAKIRPKLSTDERIFRLKELLAEYEGPELVAATQPSAEEISAEIAAWRAAQPTPVVVSAKAAAEKASRPWTPGRPGGGAGPKSRKPRFGNSR